jgi:hypothetical protein
VSLPNGVVFAPNQGIFASGNLYATGPWLTDTNNSGVCVTFRPDGSMPGDFSSQPAVYYGLGLIKTNQTPPAVITGMTNGLQFSVATGRVKSS